MVDKPTWFDEAFYLNSKLNQLQKTDASWTMANMQKAIADAGLTPFSHFSAFGFAERTSPNPSFNAFEYLHAKLKQLQDAGQSQYTNIDQVADAISGAGMDLWGHFQSFGWKEGVNPSNAFDIEGYFESKLAELIRTDSAGGWDTDKLKAAFSDAGLDPVSHFAEFGKVEGVEPVVVPEGNRVEPDPNPVEPDPNPVEPGPAPAPEPVEPDLGTFTVTEINGVVSFSNPSGNNITLKGLGDPTGTFAHNEGYRLLTATDGVTTKSLNISVDSALEIAAGQKLISPILLLSGTTGPYSGWSITGPGTLEFSDAASDAQLASLDLDLFTGTLASIASSAEKTNLTDLTANGFSGGAFVVTAGPVDLSDDYGLGDNAAKFEFKGNTYVYQMFENEGNYGDVLIELTGTGLGLGSDNDFAPNT